MKIVLLEPLNISQEKLATYEAKLTAAGHNFTAYSTRASSDQELISRAKQAEILIIANQPISKQVIYSCLDLKFISVAFTGFDHLPMEVCRKQDILVANAAGYADQSVAELVFGLTISLLRKLSKSDQAVRNSQTRTGLIGQQLAGKKFGIIGFGKIGQKTAQLAGAFGCELLVEDHKKIDLADDLVVKYLSLADVMAKSDIISLHLPLNSSTKGLIDAEKIALMKKDAILINTARGAVVDNEALAQALNKDQIGGAGIDVFEMEPPIPADHPLINAKNTILTPHLAFATKAAFNERAEIVFNNINNWLAGEPENIVN